VRVVFMGTPEFAVPSLERLSVEHQIAAVYVRPDAVSGRGGVARAAAVKVAALRLELPVRQPETLRDIETQRELAALEAEIVCVAAYGLILPPAVLTAARLGAVNVHASLLPRWRGAAPIQRAILAGDTHVGVSIMRMEEGLDTGPYCLQRSIPADDKGALALTAELGELGAELLVSSLPSIADQTAIWTSQVDDEATYASKVTKADVAPDPELSANANLLRVRASTPAAPPRILVNGKGVTVMSATLSDSADGLDSGSLRLQTGGIALGTRSGALLALRVRPDGKAEMDATAWACGARLDAESVWSSAR